MWLLIGVVAAGLLQMERVGHVAVPVNSQSLLAQPWVAIAGSAGLMPEHPLPVFLLGVFLNSWLLLAIANLLKR
jgi:hypothetical protein